MWSEVWAGGVGGRGCSDAVRGCCAGVQCAAWGVAGVRGVEAGGLGGGFGGELGCYCVLCV